MRQKSRPVVIIYGRSGKTMTNAEWILHEGWKFSDLSVQVFDIDNITIYHKGFLIDRYHVAGCRPVNALLKWLEAPHKEKILTDKEKKYLSAVIKPFRHRIIKIWKAGTEINEWINICVEETSRGNIPYTSTISLPNFPKESMYKGMKKDWNYTVEELGL